VRPTIWWRDDDARSPTPALDRLLTLAGGRPLTLAVIPLGDLAPLAAHLLGAPSVNFAQHGVHHHNRRPPGEPPGEHRRDSSVEMVADAVLHGREAMIKVGLHPDLYVPPWNQLDETHIAALPGAGYSVLSAGMRSLTTPCLTQISAEIDIMCWRDARPRFRGSGRILGAVRAQLQRRRRAGALGSPIGLLTHHLEHDAPAWRFLEWLAPFLDESFRWCTALEAAERA